MEQIRKGAQGLKQKTEQQVRHGTVQGTESTAANWEGTGVALTEGMEHICGMPAKKGGPAVLYSFFSWVRIGRSYINKFQGLSPIQMSSPIHKPMRVSPDQSFVTVRL